MLTQAAVDASTVVIRNPLPNDVFCATCVHFVIFLILCNESLVVPKSNVVCNVHNLKYIKESIE
jgi:hypothetical protein